MQQVNSPVHNWEYILENSVLGDDYSSVEELRESLEAGDLLALQKTAAVIRQYNWGLVDSLDTFKKWIAAVIENIGLSNSGIFFIWDEFTEYVANSDEQTILQQLSEFCKVQPFFMLFVVHRTTAMVERITPERYQLITHRFHHVEFHISTDAAFDMIAGSINIRNGMSEHWKEERKRVIQNIQAFLPDMSGLDDKISEQIEHLCPMHPMTIKLLSRVAENYAASQRTMFRFMKDQSNSEHGFVGYINKEGPDSQACWLTPEWLWDYFFTRESDFSDKDTKAAEYIRHYEESRHLVENDENAHRVFKTAMLLLALMSSTKGIYSGRRAKDGIAATKDCLETCLAGVMGKTQIEDMLQTMVDGKILVLDEGSNTDIPSVISHEIFEKRIDKPDWVDEFKALASVMTIKPDPDYFEAVDAIPEFEKRLDYITNAIREERIYLLKMVGQWMRKDAEQVNGSVKLKETFPALSAYLSHDLDVFQSDIGAYMSRYKAHKLENTLPSDEMLYFSGANTSSFDYRYAVLSEYEDDDTIILWVDALGIEWLPLLYWGIANNCDGTITNVALAQATLPTETNFNEQWNSMSMPYKKLNKLDKLAHKGVIDEPDYYTCIEEQMDFVTGISNQVSSLLAE